MNHELPNVQAGFRKGRGTRDQIANINWIIGKARKFQKKNILLLYWLCQRLWLCRSQQTVENSSKDGQTTLPASQEICMQVKKQQLEPDMEQQTGSKSGNEYIKAVCCHPAYLNYMLRISCKMLDWMKHKLESRLLEEISITSDMQMTPPLWQKMRRNWRASWESKRGE